MARRRSQRRRALLRGIGLLLLLLVGGGLALVTIPPPIHFAVKRHGPVPATVMTPRPDAPQPPTDVSLSGTTAGAALLSWRPPRRRPAGYRIDRAVGHDEPPAIVAVIKDPTITRYTDTDLAGGAVYE